MRIRFIKATPGAVADSITCERDDGTTVTAALPREGVLPRLAHRYVVEATLGWREGVFGAIADGQSIEAASKFPGTAKASGRLPAELVRRVQSELVADRLQAEQWGGASEPAVWQQGLAVACRERHVPVPAISVEQLARLRAAVREFGAAWRPLPPGGALERTG